MIYSLNWRVEVGTDEFIYRDFFGIKRKYKFDEIEVKQLASRTNFYCKNKRVLSITYFQVNWGVLEKSIYEYKKKQKNKE